jgi:RNA polymerase sigma factor (sigma-70 family)
LLEIEPRAVSLKPPPTVFLRGEVFMDYLQRICSSITVSVAPSDPRYDGHTRRARRDREWKSAAALGTALATPPGGAPDGDLCVRASRAAFKRVSRSGLPWWAVREDLLSDGCTAILEAHTKDEPLAITVAHRAMVDSLRREALRQLDREWSSGEDPEPDGILDGERSWNVHGSGEPQVARRYGTKKPGVAGRDTALWELMKALPPRQYTAIGLRLEGCSDEEIAQRMGATPKAVEGLLARARNSMLEILNP